MHRILLSVVAALVMVLGFSGVSWGFEDDEGCLMCHKYPKMGRMDSDGNRKTYYVVPGTFSRTVHRNVPCRDCHYFIKELPHAPVTEGVRCDQECHLVKNPSTGRPFTHKPIYDVYKESVHGRTKIAEGVDKDRPYCTGCHTNPIYNPNEDAPPKRITDRCVVCHEDDKFAFKWYNHTSRRIREVKRTSQEIVEMCGICHTDKELIDRHLDEAKKVGKELGRKFPFAVESYIDSFHGKVTKYGNTDAANCLDCHVDQNNYYMSVHNIRNSRDPQSSIHPDNRVATCRRCHTSADENYAMVDPHPSMKKEYNPVMYWANTIYTIVGDTVFFALLSLAAMETIGRRRDGIGWRIRNGSSWWRPSKRGRDRIGARL